MRKQVHAYTYIDRGAMFTRYERLDTYNTITLFEDRVKILER